MVGALSHFKSLTEADFTGTVTVFNSAGQFQTQAATDLVRPSNWNSAHQAFVTISGNTAGQSTASGVSNLVLAGGNNITLSMVTAASAATISISELEVPMSRFTDWGMVLNNTYITASASASIGGFASASARVFDFPNPVSFTRIDIPILVSLAATTANTSVWMVEFSSAFVIYSNNAGSLSPIVGVSGTNTVTWASNSTATVAGARYFSFGIATSLPAGEYYAVWSLSTVVTSTGTASTSSAGQMSIMQPFAFNSLNTGSNFADFGVATGASTGTWFAGIFSNSLTATNETLAQSTFTVTGTANYHCNVPLLFRAL